MSWASFFRDGHVADVLLLVMALEFAALAWTAPRPRRRRVAAGVALAIAPGACLAMALRMALTGATWPWIALWLGLALPFHLGDLFRRRR